MSVPRRFLFAILTIAIFGAAGGIFISRTYAANECDNIPGAVPIVTEADRKAATAANIPTSAKCWNPTDKNIGMDASQAKAYLISLPKEKLSSCGTDPSIPSNIERLKTPFAICAAKFLKAYAAKYGGVVITSAYRDNTPGSATNGSGKSANACAGGATQSNHSIGIAIDVKPAGTTANPAFREQFKKMWDFASQNPQFGVCFPFQDKPFSGYPHGDYPHMILAGTGGTEGSKCAAQGVAQACDGSNFDPKDVQPSGQTPSQQITSGLQKILGISDQQDTNCPQGMYFVNGRCTIPTQMSSAQSPFQSTQMVSPSPQQSSGSGGSSPSSGGSSLPSSVSGSSGSLLTTSNTSGASVSDLLSQNKLDTSPAATSTAAIDLINAIANPTTTPKTISTSTATLNSSTQQPGANDLVQQNKIPSGGFNASSSIYATATEPIAGNNTFTSTDLSDSPGTGSQTYQSSGSTFQNTISEIKAVLGRIAEYLQPFRGRIPNVGD